MKHMVAATTRSGEDELDPARTSPDSKPAAPATGGSPPADSKPAGFSDHADGRSSQPQVRARAPDPMPCS